MKKLILLLLPLSIFAQDSWVRFEVTFDFYAPTESNFFMVSNSYGDTSMYYQPTTPYEVLDTILPVFSGDYTISLRDNFGDGWTSSLPASFVMSNSCQGDLIDWNPVVGSFFQRDTVITVLPCPPPGPPSQCVPTTVIINLDQYPSETSWDIKDSTGTVVLNGGPYSNVPNYQPQVINNCLLEGNFTFTIYDVYGDGLAGSLWGGQDGSYYVLQCGDTLVDGNVANFGNDSTHAFTSDTCVPPPPIYGCMDIDYLEFDPLATANDSTYCVTLKIYGCTDATMFNYNPSANTTDFIDSCLYMLIMNDLIGNGWVGTNLIINELDTFTLDSGFTDTQYVWLQSPASIEVVVEFLPLTAGTATECGWSLTSPSGFVMYDLGFGYVLPFQTLQSFTDCGNSCEPIAIGCMDTLAWNYDSLANTNAVCYYYPGCTSPAYLAYHVDTASGYFADINIQDSCLIGGLAIFGCTDFLAFNYNSLANVDNGGCLPVILGCMESLAFNFNPLANTPDTCIALSYGCTDATMFNYDPFINTDDGSCTPFIFGCTDSTAFNYNPLANADNSSCNPFVLGCTDPSMLNYNPLANTENFSCIEFVYGCMDETAINYDPLANTENNSCIALVEGCMDPAAFNYSGLVNYSDSASCLYSANCISGNGTPYWLNDPCYAWVIEVDSYCCDNEWDEVCQLTYDYCDGSYIGNIPARINNDKKLIKVTDLLGRPSKQLYNKILFYMYNDGTVEKRLTKK